MATGNGQREAQRKPDSAGRGLVTDLATAPRPAAATLAPSVVILACLAQQLNLRDGAVEGGKGRR